MNPTPAAIQPARSHPTRAGLSQRSLSQRTKRATQSAVIAAAPLLLAEADLQASIVYYDTELYFDLNSGSGVWSWTFPDALGFGSASRIVASFWSRTASVGFSLFNGFGFGTNGSWALLQIPAAESIDDRMGFISTLNTAGLPANETPAYYGFRIESNVNPSTYHYGWVELRTSAVGDELWIHRWAIEDQADTAIASGAVPEAADFALGLGALAAGAATVLRKRRKEAA